MKAIDILRGQLAFANDKTEALIRPMRDVPLTARRAASLRPPR